MSIAEDFHIFSTAAGRDLTYLDSAATVLKPRSVIEASRKYEEEFSANVHRGIYTMSEKATEEYEAAREKVRAFLNARSSREIIFTRNTTESINLLAFSLGKSLLRRGDHVLTSIAEHHSNFLPWQRLRDEKGVILDVVDINEEGRLNLDGIKRSLHPRTKIASLSHVSHVLGTVNPINKLGQIFKEGGVVFVVDAAQSASHMPLDIKKMNCDFLAFSGHKIGGPTGIGVLYGREEILNKMPPFLLGGGTINEVSVKETKWHELPWKFEAGTPNISGAIGLGAAIDYINKIGLDRIRKIDEGLMVVGLRKLLAIPGLRIFGPRDPKQRCGIISFTIDGIHPHDLATILDEDKICVRAGHHCAMPLMKRLGVYATSRVSFWVYNKPQDINVLIEGIHKAVNVLKPRRG